MAKVRKREGKNGVSWQIDYFEPPNTIVKSFRDEVQAKKALERALDEDPEARAKQLEAGCWQLTYFGKKRVRLNIRGTKKEADAELAKRVSMIAESPKRYLNIKEQKSYTFDELIECYREHFRDQTAYQTGKRHHVDLVADEFKGRLLDTISYYDCETYKLKRKRTETRRKKKRAPSTLNKEVGTLRQLMRKAVEWEMIEQSPFDRGQSLQEKVCNERTRFLSEEEITRLLAKCDTWLKELVIVAIHTGMRKGELMSLTWKQIKGGFIYLPKTKNGEARKVPINEDAAAIFGVRRKRLQLKSRYVFCHETKKKDRKGHLLLYEPVGDFSTAFDKAVKDAGIDDCWFHDLRHTFASHAVMRGRTLKEVQELLGHKSIKMTMRYAHLAEKHKVDAVNALNGLTSGDVCHVLSQKGEFNGVGQGACDL